MALNLTFATPFESPLGWQKQQKPRPIPHEKLAQHQSQQAPEKTQGRPQVLPQMEGRERERMGMDLTDPPMDPSKVPPLE
jgi:hypothetical protein